MTAPRRTRTTLTRLASILAALLAALSLLAGCGSDKKAQFSKDFKPVNDQLLALAGSMSDAMGTVDNTPSATLAGEFLGFAARLEDLKLRIDGLEPPGDLKAQTNTLGKAVARLTSDARSLGSAARANRRDAIRVATAAFVRDAQVAGDTRYALAKKTGAKLGP